MSVVLTTTYASPGMPNLIQTTSIWITEGTVCVESKHSSDGSLTIAQLSGKDWPAISAFIDQQLAEAEHE